MTPFLKQVAKKYFNPTELPDRHLYIFPNRRSLLFFKKYYSELVAESGLVVLCPQMYTIADFLYEVSGKVPTDRVSLLLYLYDNYKKILGGRCESLDEFIFWGDMLLADFNDVDKYLIDARQIFANVADFKSIQEDPASYLNEKQLEAIQNFLGAVSGQVGKDGKYKETFRQTWNILLPLYNAFRQELEEKGEAYDGMVYREIACRFTDGCAADILSDIFPHTDKYIFIGLNAPTESELKILKKMKKEGIAAFCWDYSSDWIKDKNNKSSFFLREHLDTFGQDIDLDPEGLKHPEINILSVSSSVGQCKQLAQIFRRLGDNIPGTETAVVLPDENLLIPTLNSLPEEIKEVNVTMGYPMSGSLTSALIDNICSLQMHVRRTEDGHFLFYYKQAYDIFANPLFKQVLSDEEKEKIKAEQQQYRHYIPVEDLDCKGDILKLIFTPVVQNSSGSAPEQIDKICSYLMGIIERIALHLKEKELFSLELDFAKDYHTALRSLQSHNMSITPATLFHLLGSLVRRSSVPFKGEPLQGLQIMGPLETRALDFRNVIILSCNEGVFPRHVSSESFIPPELKRGFGLPTHEYQDALWAYYFYRLIQRAENVWMVYCSNSQQKLASTEESRFIKQLSLYFNAPMQRYIAKSPIEAYKPEDYIEKTQEHIDKLTSDKVTLSASSLTNYLNCPAQFFYSKIEGLKKTNEVKEYLDNAMLGTVVHATMQTLYQGHKTVDSATIKGFLKEKTYIPIIESKIKEQIKSSEITGRDLVSEHLICQYVKRILEVDRRLSEQYGGIKIIGLEKNFYTGIETSQGKVQFKGIVDRLDSLTADSIRIVDYKSGSVGDNDTSLDDGNVEKVTGLAFGEKNKDRPKIAIQMFIYNLLISSRKEFKDKKIKTVIYQPYALTAGTMPEENECGDKFMKAMNDSLKACIEEMLDINTPWKKKSEEKTCEYCDFKTICGK